MLREPSLRPLLEEWKHFAARPEHADEPITVETALVSKDPAVVLRALTPQRVRLFEYLRDHPGVESLRQLAHGLRRNYRNVHDDATALAKTGILELERHPNRLVPRVRADSIQIEV